MYTYIYKAIIVIVNFFYLHFHKNLLKGDHLHDWFIQNRLFITHGLNVFFFLVFLIPLNNV